MKARKFVVRLCAAALAALMVVGFAPAVLAAPEEIQITITHNNPNHYEGAFTATATVTDSQGTPIEGLRMGMKMYVNQGYMGTYATTDENGQVCISYDARAGAQMAAEFSFGGNETYAAKTVKEDLFVTVSDTPVLNTHWELDSYSLNDEGRVTSYTLQLCDENGEAIKKTMMLSGSTGSVDLSVVDGKVTCPVYDTNYEYPIEQMFFSLQTVVGEEVYPEMRFTLTLPVFEFTQPITYGVPYTAVVSGDRWFPSALREDGAAVCTLPDGTEVPLTYVENLDQMFPNQGYYRMSGLVLQLTGEQTSQQGTYTLSFPEKKAAGATTVPYAATTVCEKKVFTLTPQEDTITIAPGDAAVGETVFVQCEAGEGYAQALTSVTAQLSDGTEVTLSPQADGTYAFSMPNAEVKVQATFVPYLTFPISGGGSWQQGGEEELVFLVQSQNAELLQVLVDDQPLNGQQVHIKEGGASVALLPALLDTLEPGSHTLLVQYANGEASATFTVVAAQQEEQPEDLPEDQPQTGDPFNATLWWIVGGVALCGIVAAGVYMCRKKKSEGR